MKINDQEPASAWYIYPVIIYELLPCAWVEHFHGSGRDDHDNGDDLALAVIVEWEY